MRKFENNYSTHASHAHERVITRLNMKSSYEMRTSHVKDINKAHVE